MIVAASSRFYWLFVLLVAVALLSSVAWIQRTKKHTITTLKDPQFCRIIHHANVLMESGEKGETVIPTRITECHAAIHMQGDDLLGIPPVHEIVSDAASTPLGPQHVGLFLQYDAAWVDPLTQHLTLPPNLNDLDIANLLYHPSDAIVQEHWRRLGVPAPDHLDGHSRRRALQGGNASDPIFGKMIVARVRTADEDVLTTADAVAAAVFFAPNTSFAFIHEACTNGNKVVVPYDPATPVFEIALAGNSTDYTFGSFFTAAEPLLIELLGLDVGTLAEVAEYVLLVSPAGLRPTIQQPNFRFVAAGAYDSYKVVVTDDWVDTPQVLQHEIGHNYNFGHPSENNVLYGDSTSVMGQVYRNTVYNCYNGVHYAEAGWMADSTLEIDVNNDITINDGRIETNLAFYGHVDRRGDAPTLIIINGFYVLYNRATGINAETNEYANGVLLHRYLVEGSSESGTDLVAVLELSETTDDTVEAGDRRVFRSAEFGFAMELCARNDAVDSDAEADTVTLVIGAANLNVLCPDDFGGNLESDVPSALESLVPSTSPAPSTSDVPTETPVARRRRRAW